MTATPTPETHSDLKWRLRAPHWAFAICGAAMLFALALVWSTWAANGFGAFYVQAAFALAIPAGLGLALTLIGLSGRMSSGVRTRREIVVRAVGAFAIAGFIWPLTLPLAILMDGDAAGALRQTDMLAALIGAVLAGIGGAIGGTSAAFTCFEKR